MARANYQIVKESGGPSDPLTIRDIGPWNKFKTVTNAAEEVVEELIKIGALAPDQRLFYYDSDNELGELVHKDGRFTGFAAI